MLVTNQQSPLFPPGSGGQTGLYWLSLVTNHSRSRSWAIKRDRIKLANDCLLVSWIFALRVSILREKLTLIGRDAVFSLVEPYYAGTKVYVICHNSTLQCTLFLHFLPFAVLLWHDKWLQCTERINYRRPQGTKSPLLGRNTLTDPKYWFCSSRSSITIFTGQI